MTGVALARARPKLKSIVGRLGVAGLAFVPAVRRAGPIVGGLSTGGVAS